MYIGQTRRTIARRWTGHKNCSKRKKLPYNSPLYKAMKKYGIKSFVISEIEECDDELLNEREIYWIAQYNTVENGYNISRGGCGYERDPEPVVKFGSDGCYIETYSSVSEVAEEFGVIPQRIYSACYGAKLSFNGYQWRLMRDAIKVGMKLDPIRIPVKNREIHQYTLDGEYIRSYGTIKEAASQFGMKGPGGIKSTCDGRCRQSHGFRWSYEKVDKLPPIRQDRSNRPVAKLDDNGEIIKIYRTMEEAGREHNRSSCAIQAVCNGVHLKCAGYRWKYYETA